MADDRLSIDGRDNVTSRVGDDDCLPSHRGCLVCGRASLHNLLEMRW